MDRVQLFMRLLSHIRHVISDPQPTRTAGLANLVLGLFLSRSSHLPQIAGKLPWGQPRKSRVQRLERWLKNGAIVGPLWYRPFAQGLLARWAGQPILLVIDRTDLDDGQYLLYVAVACHGRALPVLWTEVGHTGATDATLQWQLLAQVQPLLPPDSPVYLLGDREFGSVGLLQLLRQHTPWHWRLRLRANVWVQLPDTTWLQLRDLSLEPEQPVSLGPVRLTKHAAWGPVYVVAYWDGHSDEPLYVAVDAPQQTSAVTDYGRRMGIDEMFSDFKTRGFNIQKTRLTDPQRLNRLLLALALTYVFVLQLGVWLEAQGLRRLLDSSRKRKLSYFQLGLRWLEEHLSMDTPWRWGRHPWPTIHL